MAFDLAFKYGALSPETQATKAGAGCMPNAYLLKLLEEKTQAGGEKSAAMARGAGGEKARPFASIRRWFSSAALAAVMAFGLTQCDNPAGLVDKGYRYDGRAVKVERGRYGFVSQWMVRLDTVVTTGPDNNRYRLATASFFFRDSLAFEWNFTSGQRKEGLVPDRSVMKEYAIECTGISDTSQQVEFQGWVKARFK